ncbi:MAG TPA: flagellar basal body rod protein FlgC [Bacteroidota bacterium]|nr:flagellar basal body rod protein FlgC [Bacteroidota bacterium]
MKIDKLFASMNISGQGLRAQRMRMNAIAENIANTETTRTENGEPYRRKIVQFKASDQQEFSTVLRQAGLELTGTDENHMAADPADFAETDTTAAGVAGSEVTDPSPFRLMYDPGHPDADADGYVKMPNVNIVNEMVDMVATTRSFEANVVAITAEKGIAKDSLEI